MNNSKLKSKSVKKSKKISDNYKNNIKCYLQLEPYKS